MRARCQNAAIEMDIVLTADGFDAALQQLFLDVRHTGDCEICRR